MALTPAVSSSFVVSSGTNLWLPAAPSATQTTDYVAPTGTIYTPQNASDLTNVLATLAREAGGVGIVLRNDVVYEGNFVLPALSGTGIITFMSVDFYNDNVPKTAQQRVTPADEAYFANIQSPNSNGAVNLGPSPDWTATNNLPSYYHFRWIKFTMNPSFLSENFQLVNLSQNVSDFDDVPRGFVLDHCWVDAKYGLSNTAGIGSRRGVLLNVRDFALIDSRVENVGTYGIDSQGIMCWEGGGEYLFDNSYISGATETFNLGGADPPVAAAGEMNPKNLTCTRCHVWKDPAWAVVTQPRLVVKNLLEHKTGDTALYEGCVFENCWAGQGGNQKFSVLFQVLADQNLSWEYDTVQDIDIRYCKFINNNGAMNILARVSYCHGSIAGGHQWPCDAVPVVPGPLPLNPCARIRMQNTLWVGMRYNPLNFDDPAIIFQLLGDTQYIDLYHNTFALDGGPQSDVSGFLNYDGAVFVDGPPYRAGTRVRGNIFPFGNYGILGNGTAGESSTFAKFDPTAIYGDSGNDGKNLVYGNDSPGAQYTVGTNVYAADETAVKFKADWSLDTGSPGLGIGIGGLDAGCDITTLETKIANTISGQWV
jgi:hypothetical protein